MLYVSVKNLENKYLLIPDSTYKTYFPLTSLLTHFENVYHV